MNNNGNSDPPKDIPSELVEATASRVLALLDKESIRPVQRGSEEDDDEGGFLLRGVPRIARFLGEDRRRTYWLLQSGRLPAVKEGKAWVTTRSALREHYSKLVKSSAG